MKKEEAIILLDKDHNYRYERKFTVPRSFKTNEIEQVIKQNTFLFNEIFEQRQVNNIYFDTVGYNDYFDNVLGVSDRKKIRIRWYGSTFGLIEKPVLEIKIKKGLVGDKWSYKLNPFMLDETFDSKSIQNTFEQSNLPIPILQSLKMVYPALLNSYNRKYFMSANNKFRITLDFDLLYYKIDRRINNFRRPPSKDKNIIVELKYALQEDMLSYHVSNQFPFRLNKNSKYVNGVNTIKQFPQ
ncbi:VTC domain-containing protein [Winogradskyella sp. 3972H.M.0a.05]|uniref:VTC domain-containing protein n=1 Tax=Winogradskyella sp. 3972H.M.0a.05 TaxID=2950277 RepID=UPI003398D33D